MEVDCNNLFQKITAWNQTRTAYPHDTCVHELFSAIARQSPQAPALVFPGWKDKQERLVTYEQLDILSGVLAGKIQKYKASQSRNIVVVMDRSIEMVVAIIGILKAGCTYVPLDAHCPRERLEYLFTDLETPLILTRSSFVGQLCHFGIPLLIMDEGWIEPRDVFSINTPAISPAYIMYTSGSTGKPKGVCVTHRGIIRLVKNNNYTKFDSHQVFLQLAPPTFDASTFELWGPLLNGGCCVLFPYEGLPDPVHLETIIRNYGITTLWLTTSLFNMIISEAPLTLRNIRQLLTGGEALSVKHVRKALELLPGTELINGYGPTECTTFSCCYTIPRLVDPCAVSIPIGKPIANSTAYVLDELMSPVPVGTEGELYLGGDGVALGYLRRSDLTAERFIPDLFDARPGYKLYKTGDKARFLEDGTIDFIGRTDNQVKIHGFRIELGEIENTLENHVYVKQCIAIVRDDIAGDKHIVAYIILNDNKKQEQSALSDIREYIAKRLPSYMNPSFYVFVETYPLSVNGKIDRNALPRPQITRNVGLSSGEVVYSKEQKAITDIWMRLLQTEQIPLDLSFFDAGGTSLLAGRLTIELQQLFCREIPVAFIFQYPTIGQMASKFAEESRNQDTIPETSVSLKQAVPNSNQETSDDIAIVGMSCQYPGVNSIESYWQMLVEGLENITFFQDDKIPADIDKDLRNNEMYVRAKGVISEVEHFDPGFFGFSHQTAEVTDPQLRLFLEHAYDALENAGHVSGNKSDKIGVYAGMGRSSYLRYNILTRPEIIDRFGNMQIDLGNDKDYIATRVSHALNLTGPGISISTACSTSLVAVIMACQALSRGDCTMVLAGGSNISYPLFRGHLHQEGAIYSSDGHSRPFDADSSGTTFGDGVGVVALKKLSSALAEKNIIYAVIKGGAINNDGAKKVCFTAPGVDGQIAVIASALQSAGVAADTISYIETHSTATQLGDPIEIEALTQAFRQQTNKKQFCAIGSVKSNIGHTLIASGVAGLIKTALMLYHKTLVPSLHFSKPNPAIEFDASPFFVNTKLAPWETGGAPRRAGVSAFGFGGTNAHVILEEPPQCKSNGLSRPWQMFPFSAKTPTALSSMLKNFREYLRNNQAVVLPDIAYTLQAHRTEYPFRAFAVCQNNEDAVSALSSCINSYENNTIYSTQPPSVIFMLPGQGTQYNKMGSALYAQEPTFRMAFDRCSAALYKALGQDIRDTLFADGVDAQSKIKDMVYEQPSLFAVEYSLSCLWRSWGIKPEVLVGHSVGEFVAACIAGIMTVEDAAALVVTRAHLMHSLPRGSMLSVRLSESEITAMLPPTLSIAAVNSPLLCVVSGPLDDVDNFKVLCEDKGVACKQIHTSYAFHSSMVDPLIPVFNVEVRKIKLSPPEIPILSTVTGQFLTNSEACDPEYWTRHMRKTVRFSAAIQKLLCDEGNKVFLEVGPRATSATFVCQQIQDPHRHEAISSLGEMAEPQSEYRALIEATGQLWVRGVSLDWASYYRDERRLQVSLPSYPFDRQRYFIERASLQTDIAYTNEPVQKIDNPSLNKLADQSSSEGLPSTQAAVAKTIRGMIGETMGGADSFVEASTTFLQMGMDSLFLTQFSQRLKTFFKVKVSSRQLMREYCTVDKLSDFILKDPAYGGRK